MPSKWVEHVKAYYRSRRAKDPKYKFSSAMRDSRASYTKIGKAGKAGKAEPKKKVQRRRKRRKAVV